MADFLKHGQSGPAAEPIAGGDVHVGSKLDGTAPDGTECQPIAAVEDRFGALVVAEITDGQRRSA